MGRPRINYICSECDKEAVALGLCMTHYQRRRRRKESEIETCIRPGCTNDQKVGSFYCVDCTEIMGWEVARKHG